jgi:ribonuclease T
MNERSLKFAKRFRGLLPIVIDIETSGLNSKIHSILEIAAVTLSINEQGKLQRDKTYAYHVEPFMGALIDPESLEITKIDPTYPLRYAIPERQALHRIFRIAHQLLAEHQCQRAVLVGHNAWFDLSFIQAAAERSQLDNIPFHSFTTFDTATLAGVFFGETVLARAARCAKINFDTQKAHSAIYDAENTADLFCHIVNRLS